MPSARFRRVLGAVAATAVAVPLASVVAAAPASAATGASIAALAEANFHTDSSGDPTTGNCSANSTGSGGNGPSGQANIGFATSCNPGEYWCADFVKWTWTQSGVSSASWMDSFVPDWRTGSPNYHPTAFDPRYQYSGAPGYVGGTPPAYTPKPGDAVIWADPNASKTNTGSDYYGEHISIVTGVSSNGWITDISGDTGGSGTGAAFYTSSHVQENEWSGGAAGGTGGGYLNPAVNPNTNNGSGPVNGWDAWIIGYVSPGASAPAVPSGFHVDIDANGAGAAGQTVSGTVELTGLASASGYVNYGRYEITGPNGYDTGQLTPSAGGGANYPYAWNTAGLAAGTYQVSFIANETDGQNHTYGPVSLKLDGTPHSGSSGLSAKADGGFNAAWKGGDGRFWVGTGSGTSMAQPDEPWLLGVADGTVPSIATMPDGSWVAAWAGGDGKLWVGTGNGTSMAKPAEPWLLGVFPGTSPSIVALSNGGWEVAWKGGDGKLWVGTGNGTSMAQPAEPWLLGVADTTSPSLAALPDGGFEVAWKGGDGKLWVGTGNGTSMAQPAEPWLLGVDTTGSSSSPSLVTFPDGSFEVAWKGGDGRLWLATGSGTSMAQPAEPWLLGVADTTSPSLAALPDGGFEVAWKGGDGKLWVGTGNGTSMAKPAEPWLLGVDTAGSSASPSLVTFSDGSYEVAWKGGDGRLWLGTGSGTSMAQPAEPWLLGVA